MRPDLHINLRQCLVRSSSKPAKKLLPSKHSHAYGNATAPWCSQCLVPNTCRSFPNVQCSMLNARTAMLERLPACKPPVMLSAHAQFPEGCDSIRPWPEARR